MKFKRTILLAGFVILMAAGCGKYAAETEVSTGYICNLNSHNVIYATIGFIQIVKDQSMI